jgi:hypothetical protein
LREAMNKAVDGVEKSGELKPLDFLLALMRDEQADRRDRLEAAKHAANFVHPRLVSQDINSRSQQVTWLIADTPPTAEEWLAETNANANIEGRSVPLGTSLQHISQIEIEMRDQRICQLSEQVSKLQDELKLTQAREAEAKRIPLYE